MNFNLANALESADEEPTVAETKTYEEDEISSDLLEVTRAGSKVAQESADLDEFDEQFDQVEELGDAIALESDVISLASVKLLRSSMARLLGTKTALAVAQEGAEYSAEGRRGVVNLATESVRDTIKGYWEFLKKQLKKFYAAIKDYYIKNFSLSKKTLERAKKLSAKVDGLTGSPEEKTFTFSQTKTIAVSGKYGDPGLLVRGVENLAEWVRVNLTVAKSDKYLNVVDKMSDKTNKFFSEIIKGFKNKVTDPFTDAFISTDNVEDEFAKIKYFEIKPLKTQTPENNLAKDLSGGTGDAADYLVLSESLPGGKAIAYLSVSEDDLKTTTDNQEFELLIKSIKKTRILLTNDKSNPRDVSEGDVKTLTQTQLSNVCSAVETISESFLDYQKAWENRERFKDRLEKDLDDVVKNLDVDNPKLERMLRNYTSAFTTTLRRRSNFEVSIMGYSLGTSNAFLNYVEKSISNY